MYKSGLLTHNVCLALFSFSDFCQDSSFEMSIESSKAGDDFIVSLFNLFSCLNNVPKALTQVLEPYLEHAQIWEHLFTLSGKVETSCFIEVLFKSHYLFSSIMSM